MIREVEHVSGITPLPDRECIAVGRAMDCEECDGGRLEDIGPGLDRIPYPVMRDCPYCRGRGRAIQFTDYNKDYLW